MPTKRSRAPQRRRRGEPEGAESVRAFIVGDRDFFVRLEPWEDTPLVVRGERCTHGHPLDTPMPGYGCQDQHEARARRRRIIAEIERLGAFTWATLDDPDDEVARVAWGRLAHVAEAVGVSEETWAEVLRAAGWDGSWEPDADGEVPAQFTSRGGGDGR